MAGTGLGTSLAMTALIDPVIQQRLPRARRRKMRPWQPSSPAASTAEHEQIALVLKSEAWRCAMIDAVNPSGVWSPFGAFSIAVIQVDGQIVLLKGQVSLDQNGDVVGTDDMRAQVRKFAFAGMTMTFLSRPLIVNESRNSSTISGRVCPPNTAASFSAARSAAAGFPLPLRLGSAATSFSSAEARR
jgi:hypothetical protein